jgi:hypothetical protein
MSGENEIVIESGKEGEEAKLVHDVNDGQDHTGHDHTGHDHGQEKGAKKDSDSDDDGADPNNKDDPCKNINN